MASTNSRSTRPAAKNGAAAAPRSTAKNGRRRGFNYPRAGKGPVRRWVPSWRFVVGSVLTLGALACGVVIAAYVSISVPDPNDMPAPPQRSTVYYSDGTTELATFASQDRILISADEIPEVVKHAAVAAEDRTFYENSGIDVKGLGRAAVGNVKALFTGGKKTGGSSITQQYAERFYTEGTTTDYVGKFKEVLMAVKIDSQQSKDQILSNYLNTIYFGRGAYGIETAAQKYFGISASELSLSQAALIAGVIPSPTNWDPRVNAEKAESRWNYVLDGMVLGGFITQEERDAQVFPETIDYGQTNSLAGQTGYLVEMVKAELEAKAGITTAELNSGGLRIVTTIDKGVQDAAVAAVEAMPEDTPANLSTSVVTIDADSGGYLAVYGGKDYIEKQFNSATQGAAQAGSTFKPFTLMAGLEAGKTLKDTFDGNSPKSFGDYQVNNFGSTDFGRVTLEKATEQSINTAYVELNEEVGPEATVDVATRAGIPADTPDLTAVPSNVLGTATVHPVDMAAAYTTFATNGQTRTPHIVDEVTEGAEVRYTPALSSEQVFTPENTAEVTYALTKVVENGSGKTVKSLGVPVAGKTGTSNDNKSAWFVGYTPKYVTAVAMYQSGPNQEQESITPFGKYVRTGITGATAPADVWTEYMGTVLEGKDVLQFPSRAKATPTPTPTPTVTPEPTEEPTEEATEEPEEATVTVPAGLAGRSEAEVRGALVAAGLNPSVTTRYDSKPKGTVVSVSPGPGSAVAAGSTVTVVVSNGPDPATIPTPEPTPAPTTPAPAPTTPAPTPTTPAPTPTTPTAPKPDQSNGQANGQGSTGQGAGAAR
ncbi:penicillin-binding protein [Sanguibacter suarezii]|uniref:penicillin-binding protein n=1 Tax=Sanguibacter suarezii TaxID=60921 RepID=UPI000AF00F7D|nr:penicillin-binding protein [Sanguibacter suarezii]